MSNFIHATTTPTGRKTETGRETDTYGRPSNATGGRGTLFDLIAQPDDHDDDDLENYGAGGNNLKTAFLKKKQYHGRYRMWPGILLLSLGLVAAIGFTVYGAIQTRSASQKQMTKNQVERRKIIDGKGDWTYEDEDETLDLPGNPTFYPDKQCAHVDYISKNNFIYAITPQGNEVKLPIKGINWSGMETSHGIPYGLWDNIYNGTTVYQVAAFLARNRFNSVRLPLSAENLLLNIVPNQGFINTATNTAINATSYRTLLKTIVKALGYRGISVLLDLHTLTPRDTGDFWYSDEISEDDMMTSIDILGQDLCSPEYYNIVGLDLKNEPAEASWGTGSPTTDWHLAAQRLGNRALRSCSKWTAHVEGISALQTISIGAKTFQYFDWWGGGLQKATEFPVQLDIDQKVVYSPHYYSPAVYPAEYFYKGGQNRGGRFENYIERDDADLKEVVKRTMHDMFGHLTLSQGNAVIMGEFGGLYGTDDHPMKTTKRVIQYTIDHLVDSQNQYGGGYVWSLNPESGYAFNPVDTIGHFQYGLLDDTWLKVHEEYLDALSAFDEIEEMKMFPCFQESE